MEDYPRSIIREIDARTLTSSALHTEILPAYSPIVLRGLVRDWPATRAARQSDADLIAYLKRFAGGDPVTTKTAPTAVAGRFGYDADATGFNFTKRAMPAAAALDQLLAFGDDPAAPAFAIQSARANRYFPAFARDNRLDLLPATIVPRLWIGNAVTVAAHYDVMENIACCVAGHRRVTLFAPDQVGNLYPGPFERTPGGQIVSMVDFDAPDASRFPRFASAMEQALVVDLAPGDALYIPYLWWHHVRSLDRVNLLVNFWWHPGAPTQPYAPEAMMLAMLSIKNLPPERRDAWRALFGHYVFGDDGPPGLHLPEHRRGIQGVPDRAEAQRMVQAIADKLAPRKRSGTLRRLARMLGFRH